MKKKTNIYKLKYLVVPDFIYEDKRLSALQLKAVSFIYTYTGDRFFFSNKRLGEMFGVKEIAISRVINKLADYKYIKLAYKIKANGGKIRYITRLKGNVESDLYQTYSQTYTKHIDKDNKIKDNKIYNTSNKNKNGVSMLLYEHYVACFNKNPNTYKPLPSKLKKIETRLKTYTPEEIAQAIKNASQDNFYIGKNDRGWKADLTWICKNDENLEKMLNLNPRGEGTIEKEFEDITCTK